MKKTLVIGYGNTLRGDDGAGIAAVRTLKIIYPQFNFLSLHQLTPDLTETISYYDAVYFIDASVDVSEVTRINLRPEVSTVGINTHVVLPQNLLNTCLNLYGRVPGESFLFHIPAYNYDFSEELSISTQERMQEFIRYFSASVSAEHQK
ncbi:MAG: hydrogenase maturation protease [Bacteroidota bacterium]|nr:hydrogenase maturation protease [Bacteroidota bacterium]